MSAAVQLEHLDFAHEGVPILEDVSLEIPAGEFLGIVGPNGGGKTTLLRVILGLLRPTGGSVRVLGRAPREARAAIGYVPQHTSFAPDFPITVGEVVRMGRLGHAPWLGRYRAADRAAALAALERLGVEALHDRPIGQLSGGERQRVLIARALAAEPRLLLLDEPTANVDPGGEAGIFEILSALVPEVTVVVVTHDIGFISSSIRRVACLNRTLVCHPTERLTPAVLESLYGSAVRAIHHGHPAPAGEHG